MQDVRTRGLEVNVERSVLVKMCMHMSAAAGLLVAASAHAAVFTLADRNATAVVDTDVGMNNWTVAGVNNLSLQGFWYRTGGMNREFNIGTLALTGSALTDTNPFIDNRADTLSLQYSGAGFTIEPTWSLRGGIGNSFNSDMAETIAIHNTGNQTLTISFFQYSDFDLGGTVQDQSVRFTGFNNNTAQQTDIGFAMNETVVTPAPSRWQVDTFPVTLNALNDAVVTNLNNNAGPIGPGDLTWAYQWDFVIPVGGTVLISKDKSLMPTPGSLALLGMSGLILGRRRR